MRPPDLHCSLSIWTGYESEMHRVTRSPEKFPHLDLGRKEKTIRFHAGPITFLFPSFLFPKADGIFN